jgi:2-amino-4-hydroxy-6-hydroxymethyldihydropteridine diphosphokinase
MSVRAAIGVGSNLGDPPANVRTAIGHLRAIGNVTAVSRLYRTKPWGLLHQPDFCNAAAIVETELEPAALLDALKAIEQSMGRQAGERWGPRLIDLDILLYGDHTIDRPGLHVPHPRLHERAFALVPLADVDPRYAQAAAGLLSGKRETVALMPEESLVQRVRSLAQAFLETDLMRLRIQDANDDAIEFRRKPVAAARRQVSEPEDASGAALHGEPLKADLVGIFRFGRPGVHEGERLDGDRELGYVEALGIRNPVRSLGGGRISAVRVADGEAVDYGRVLFEIER